MRGHEHERYSLAFKQSFWAPEIDFEVHASVSVCAGTPQAYFQDCSRQPRSQLWDADADDVYSFHDEVDVMIPGVVSCQLKHFLY